MIVHKTELLFNANMDSKVMIHLQKCLFLNILLSSLWLLVVAFFLTVKMDYLGHLTKYLALTVFTLLIGIEYARLYLGYYGNLTNRVPELAGFLMLTLLMQMPLVSFFLFNPYLLNTPTEITLHCLLWLLSIFEVILGFLALKNASYLAKTAYLVRQKKEVRL